MSAHPRPARRPLDRSRTDRAPILEAVRKRGDKALLEYARKFDGLERKTVAVVRRSSHAPPPQAALTPEFQRRRRDRLGQHPRLRQAAVAHKRQIKPITPPASSSARSSARSIPWPPTSPPAAIRCPPRCLMTVVPAQVAGVPNICVCFAQAECDEILGTASILAPPASSRWAAPTPLPRSPTAPRPFPARTASSVPGNIYVAAAKKLLAGEVGIDFVAGPTEILIIADEGNPRLDRRRHAGPGRTRHRRVAILLTTSRNSPTPSPPKSSASWRRCPPPPRRARPSTRTAPSSSCASLDEAVEISNRFAPEHLSLHDPSLLPGIVHAGSVFLGPWSPEAAGDYASGPNHVLPTSGAARLRGGLSSADYVKVISVQELNAGRPEAAGPPPSRRWPAPKAWKRTPAAVEVRRGDGQCLPAPRPAVVRMAPYHPPTGGRQRGQAASRLQRKHRRLLAARDRRPRRTRSPKSDLAVYPEYGKPRAAALASSSAWPRTSSCSPTAPTKPFRCWSTPTSTTTTTC